MSDWLRIDRWLKCSIILLLGIRACRKPRAAKQSLATIFWLGQTVALTQQWLEIMCACSLGGGQNVTYIWHCKAETATQLPSFKPLIRTSHSLCNVTFHHDYKALLCFAALIRCLSMLERNQAWYPHKEHPPPTFDTISCIGSKSRIIAYSNLEVL